MQFHPVNIDLDGGPVLTGWCTREGHQTVLFFTHGNGFCGRVYQPMHELLAQKHDLLMLDIPGHGNSPAAEFVGWNQTAEYLWQALQSCSTIVNDRDVHAVGHSLGGMLSMLLASEHPDTFKSMVLLDPIMFPQPMFFMMHVISRLGLTAAFHPFVKPTLRRRNGWSGRQEAFDYFHKRKIFEHWTDESLNSYVAHAMVESEPGRIGEISSSVQLCCEPTLEARWFATLPDKLWPSIKTLPGPVAMIMGEDTYPFSLRAARQAQRVNSAVNFSQVPGGHCFMQEYPAEAAGYVLKALIKHKSQLK